MMEMLMVEMLLPLSTSTLSEEVGKDVVIVHVIELLIATATLALTLFVLTDTLFTLLIVNTALVSVGQGVVGVCNRLKLLFGGFRVVLVLVGVVLDGKFLERLLDLRFSRVPFEAHNFVIVFTFRFCLLLRLLSLLTALLLTIMLSHRER